VKRLGSCSARWAGRRDSERPGNDCMIDDDKRP